MTHIFAPAYVHSPCITSCIQCRGLLQSMFEWVVPPMLRVATRMVRAPLPMQDLNLAASCMRLLDALLVPEFRDKPQTIAEMADNVQMVSHCAMHMPAYSMISCRHSCLLLHRGDILQAVVGACPELVI